MLGIDDFWVAFGYGLCVAAALLCIGYGIVNWNRGAGADDL